MSASLRTPGLLIISAPWSSLKSDIVSLRLHSQSSAGLSIVGGNKTASWDWYTGAGDKLRISSADQLQFGQRDSSRQVLERIFPDMGKKLHTDYSLPLLACSMFLLSLLFLIVCDCSGREGSSERASEVIKVGALFFCQCRGLLLTGWYYEIYFMLEMAGLLFRRALSHFLSLAILLNFYRGDLAPAFAFSRLFLQGLSFHLGHNQRAREGRSDS